MPETDRRRPAAPRPPLPDVRDVVAVGRGVLSVLQDFGNAEAGIRPGRMTSYFLAFGISPDRQYGTPAPG